MREIIENDNSVISCASDEDEREKDVVISVQNVSKKFNIANQNVSSLKEYMIKIVKRKLSFREFYALKDISFDVCRGEVVGLIGTNGSGKSTLLKIISGALKPSEGKVVVDTSKVQILSLGTGFDSELTARENVYLSGAIIGYSREFIDSVYDDIVSFAELDGFMEEKVKNFSSGMVSRLGFAISTVGSVPEILILDEVLSVGDEFFRKKSLAKIKEIIHSGSTVIIVSHNMSAIRENCDKVVWIEKGKLKMVGSPSEVCNNYKNNIDSELPSQIKLTGAEAKEDNIEVSWEKDETADSYIVFRKYEKTQWKKIGTSEEPVFIDQTGVSGIAYTYTVRGVNKKGMSASYDKKGVTAVCTAVPENVRLIDAAGFEKQIIVRWKPVRAACRYNVYRKTDDDTQWTKIAVTDGSKYSDHDVEQNRSYCYTVRAFNKYGISRRYDREGVKAVLQTFDKETIKVSIVGSCQSRDIFNSKFIADYRNRFEVLSYFTMGSMLSVMSKPVTYDYNNLEQSAINNYQKERFFCEFEKNILKTLATKVPDVLILDFYADARYGVIAYDNGYILNRNARIDGFNILDPQKIGSVYNYRVNKDEYLKSWKNAFDKFMVFLNKYLPDTRIVMNTVKGSNMICDAKGNRYLSPKLVDLNIKAINNIWSEMDEYVISTYEDRVTPLKYEKNYDLDPDYLFGLGVALVHFHPEYYNDYYENLLLATSDLKSAVHSNSNTNLIRDPDFSDFREIWTDVSDKIESAEHSSHKFIRIKPDQKDQKDSSAPEIWSRPVEIDGSSSAVYTLSFDLLIPENISDLKDITIFKIRSFKYFNNHSKDDAIEEKVLDLNGHDIKQDEIYRYTYSFSTEGKYVRVSPVFNDAVRDMEIGNVQLERNDKASGFKEHSFFEEYLIDRID